MRRLLSVVVVFVLACSASLGGGDKKQDNPFKNAKVGDYISYKMTTTIGENTIEGSMKQSVSKVDEKTVTLDGIAMLLGQEKSLPSTTIDLTKPYDPATAVNQQGKNKGKFEKTGEGKEKLKVNGKEYECNWIAGKASAAAAGLKIDSEIKVWFSSAIPLNGMLKMETKMNVLNMDTTVIMEMSEFGNAKEKEKDK